MILAVDVQYRDKKSYVAGVGFNDWKANEPLSEFMTVSKILNEYVPGEFYKRELPCILELLNEHSIEADTLIIDGFVFLDGHSKAGLGKHLFEALNSNTKVIGVAKNRFQGISENYAVYRGESKKAIYVTAVGIDLESAKKNIEMMHGEFRIPKLLKRADQLCRERASASSA